MKRVFELALQALERYPMLEAQALWVLWMSRYEKSDSRAESSRQTERSRLAARFEELRGHTQVQPPA